MPGTVEAALTHSGVYVRLREAPSVCVHHYVSTYSAPLASPLASVSSTDALARSGVLTDTAMMHSPFVGPSTAASKPQHEHNQPRTRTAHA